MSLKVLIVDDEDSLRANLSAYLEDEGMDVTAVDSAEDALKVVRQGECFDACVMDLRLPGMDGNDAIWVLHRHCPSTKYVIHTGTAGYTPPEDLRSLGVSDEDVFVKPLDDMAAIAEAIRRTADKDGRIEHS
jgi:CheY-like chemotaxis protein